MARAKKAKQQRIILCCGEHGRGVVIGDVDAEPTFGQPVRLHNARMVLYWHESCGGLLGLAARGPKGATRITHSVPVVVETVWQEWVAVTGEASEALDKWLAC